MSANAVWAVLRKPASSRVPVALSVRAISWVVEDKCPVENFWFRFNADQFSKMAQGQSVLAL